MIISLRGTNGAGKSTIVRSIMSEYVIKIPLYSDGKRRPYGYLLSRYESRWEAFVPGHYEIANGGIDTLAHTSDAYCLIEQYHKDIQTHVLYEGKNMSDGIRNLSRFSPREVVIIFVDHPVDDCIQSVRDRGHNIQENTIRNLAKKAARNADEFEQKGFLVFRLGRENALRKCREILLL